MTTSTRPNSLDGLVRAVSGAKSGSNAALGTSPSSEDEITTGSIPPAASASPPPPSAALGNAARAPVVGADRSQVFPQLASASVEPAGALAAARQPSRSARRPELSLRDAVAAAVTSHPLMGAQASKVTGSLADVRAAQGALHPQVQVYAGSGGSYLGTYANYPTQFGSAELGAGSRSDAGLVLKQLVFDFGAAKADIARSRSLVDAERLRLADQAEDIALRTANAYLNLLEQGELIVHIDKVVADNNNFASLVNENEKQGNGTAADVNRIRSKVIEVEAFRTDIKTAYDIARDEFSRLTKLEPRQVRRPTPVFSSVPPTFEAAFEAAKRNNPSLLALSATGTSFGYQLESQRAQRLPRVDIQGDGLVKHYAGMGAASQGVVDSRIMVMGSYKLWDGGTLSAQADRIQEDRRANDFKTLDEKESIELNLRRFYQALSANRAKEGAAGQGVETAQKAYSLYLEQFKAGKRTVFEVLDSRMVVFTMHKNSINAKYEQIRAAYGILRNMGRLVETCIRI